MVFINFFEHLSSDRGIGGLMRIGGTETMVIKASSLIVVMVWRNTKLHTREWLLNSPLREGTFLRSLEGMTYIPLTMTKMLLELCPLVLSVLQFWRWSCLFLYGRIYYKHSNLILLGDI